MSSNSEPVHLNNHHRDTLLQIFQHPIGHNIEWHAVVSLLEAVGTVELRHDGKYLVRVGGESEVITRPRGKDIGIESVHDLRRMLTRLGTAQPSPKWRARKAEATACRHSPRASSRATRPSRSATVTVSAEWPFRRKGEATGSRK